MLLISLFLCHVFPQPTSCIYVHVGKTPASLTPSLFQNKPSSYLMIHRLEFHQRPIECPPMKSGSSNAPTPTPPHHPPSHLSPIFPNGEPVDPTSFFFSSHHDRTPVKVTFLNLRLSSHLILSSRTMICSKRNANERPRVRRQDSCHRYSPLNLRVSV